MHQHRFSFSFSRSCSGVCVYTCLFTFYKFWEQKEKKVSNLRLIRCLCLTKVSKENFFFIFEDLRMKWTRKWFIFFFRLSFYLINDRSGFFFSFLTWWWWWSSSSQRGWRMRRTLKNDLLRLYINECM